VRGDDDHEGDAMTLPTDLRTEARALLAQSRHREYLSAEKLREVIAGLLAHCDALEQENARLKERVSWFERSGGVDAHTRVFVEMHRADALEQRLDDVNVKDRAKTREINLLTAEVRELLATLARLRELVVRADSYLSLLWHRHVPANQKDSDLRYNVERTIADVRAESKALAESSTPETPEATS
jgi:hypothetical protein